MFFLPRESNLLLDQPCWLLVINLVTLDQLHRCLVTGHLDNDHGLLQNCTGRDYRRQALSSHSALVLQDQGEFFRDFEGAYTTNGDYSRFNQKKVMIRLVFNIERSIFLSIFQAKTLAAGRSGKPDSWSVLILLNLFDFSSFLLLFTFLVTQQRNFSHLTKIESFHVFFGPGFKFVFL